LRIAANPIGRPFTNTIGIPAASPNTASSIPSNVFPPALPEFPGPVPIPIPVVPGAGPLAPAPPMPLRLVGGGIRSVSDSGSISNLQVGQVVWLPNHGARQPAWKRCPQGKARTSNFACVGREAFLFLAFVGLVPVGTVDVEAEAEATGVDVSGIRFSSMSSIPDRCSSAGGAISSSSASASAPISS